MKTWFLYNWQVRKEWYHWCEALDEEELLRARTGGVGGILKTLFHIVDVEWSWIRVMEDKPDTEEDFEEYSTLAKVMALDARYHQDVSTFVEHWYDGLEHKIFVNHRHDGSVEEHMWGEIMRHIVAHEIHHIGQLSVWSRELGLQPPSANLIRRGLRDSLPPVN